MPTKEHKHCPKCQTRKPVDKFYPNAARYDGIDVYCIACRREIARTAEYKNQPSNRKQWGDKMFKQLHLDGSDY